MSLTDRPSVEEAAFQDSGEAWPDSRPEITEGAEDSTVESPDQDESQTEMLKAPCCCAASDDSPWSPHIWMLSFLVYVQIEVPLINQIVAEYRDYRLFLYVRKRRFQEIIKSTQIIMRNDVRPPV